MRLRWKIILTKNNIRVSRLIFGVRITFIYLKLSDDLLIYDMISLISPNHIFFNQFKLKAFLCVMINDFSWFMFNHQDGVLLVLCPQTHCWMVSSVWCPPTHWCGCVLPPWCPPTHWCQKRRSKLPGHPRISHKIIKSTIFCKQISKLPPKAENQSYCMNLKSERKRIKYFCNQMCRVRWRDQQFNLFELKLQWKESFSFSWWLFHKCLHLVVTLIWEFKVHPKCRPKMKWATKWRKSIGFVLKGILEFKMLLLSLSPYVAFVMLYWQLVEINNSRSHLTAQIRPCCMPIVRLYHSQ